MSPGDDNVPCDSTDFGSMSPGDDVGSADNSPRQRCRVFLRSSALLKSEKVTGFSAAI
ncbi:MAG: hypothetical protein LBT62_02765 [Deltaproteobacteria bacterium]|nr:hypothetical protein [Deltaproteobacteria bacterium]